MLLGQAEYLAWQSTRDGTSLANAVFENSLSASGHGVGRSVSEGVACC